MDTPVMFPDAQRAVRDLLRVVLAARSDPVAVGAVVSTKPPAQSDERPLTKPHIQVRTDGQARDSRLNGRATVRLLVWHLDEGLGEDLAALCEALLLASTSGTIRGCSSVMGPMPTGDTDTGAARSFFTITARLRPVQL